MKRLLLALALLPCGLGAQAVDTVEVVGITEIASITDDCPRANSGKIEGRVGETIVCTLAALDSQGDTVPAVWTVTADQPAKQVWINFRFRHDFPFKML